MVYIRGYVLDYDRWEKEGVKGWFYVDCLLYFRKVQCYELGVNDYRGGDGLFQVFRGKINNLLFYVFIEVGVQVGYFFIDDMNGY